MKLTTTMFDNSYTYWQNTICGIDKTFMSLNYSTWLLETTLGLDTCNITDLKFKSPEYEMIFILRWS